ncbi:hypothetical protein ACVINH_002770 [Rhizobium anhuiense]|jgi:hypothetical protein|nr:hypothetical protein [Rhizobium sp. BK112]MBB3366871.1 hypothetical protein [Rhizobium sp. BK077]MBB4177773.1 hypothetical protein [Rhizobium sp. BK109]
MTAALPIDLSLTPSQPAKRGSRQKTETAFPHLPV